MNLNILDMLYTLIIGPLKLLFESLFNVFYNITGKSNYGLCILLLSITMNTFLLPLYNRADKIQEEENNIEKKLKPGVDHIKKTFKGDERYMILQTYYKQNNYNQFNVLKGSISLLLEVPFFIAAYDFLSNVKGFRNTSLGPITSLAEPDALLFGINVLPIVMTIINIISSVIYTKGQSTRSKIQLYGIAILFLVLLYDSPSGLVLYWTFNNLYSLIKNCLVKLKNKTILTYISSFIGLSLLIYLVLNLSKTTSLVKVCILVLIILLELPLIIHKTNFRMEIPKALKYNNKNIFIIMCIYLSVFIGLYISSNIINSSPQEFVDITTLINPNRYILYSFLLALGTFCIWFVVYYYLSGDNVRLIFNWIITSFVLFFTINYFVFDRNLGTMSNLLVYDAFPQYSFVDILLNSIILLLIIIVIYIFGNKVSKYIKKAIVIMTITVLAISLVSINLINNDYNKTTGIINESNHNDINLPLSTKGKNVVVIMLDAAVNEYFPYLINEKTELLDMYSGFTYYPNTISYGGGTNVGSPSLMGGYEYIPANINNRTTETLAEKQNEALKVMPVLFDNIGYEVSVCDPPLAGYSWISDLSIYNEYENIKTYSSKNNIFHQDELDSSFITNSLNILERNLFCHSLFRIAPAVIKTQLYDGGSYNSIHSIDHVNHQKKSSISKADGVYSVFVNNFATLINMPNFTTIENNDKNTFFFIDNETTHDSELLSEPEYIMSYEIDNTEYDKEHEYRFTSDGNKIKFNTIDQAAHYETNMGVLLKVGKWLDYLKDNNVYDNTRIIIVSDHGKQLNQFDNLILEDGTDITRMSALLLYKDFNSKEFKIDNSFMTNADTPLLATKDLIENPINPFTGVELSNYDKTERQHILICDASLIESTTFPEGQWYSVSDNIYDINNWKIENGNK